VNDRTRNLVHGLIVPGSEYRPVRDCLQVDIEPTSAGNVVVRVHQEINPGGPNGVPTGVRQVGHVVLTYSEAMGLAAELIIAAGKGA